MASPTVNCPMLDEKLTNEIFSILENKFLFGKTSFTSTNTINSSSPAAAAGKVRILSIDAGDGILAANTLLHLQSILRAKSGKPTAHIADFFDVAAGSGAGGVLAGLLFTRKDGAPILSAEQALKFLLDNHRSLNGSSAAGVFGRRSKAGKALNKVLGDATLKDTIKGVLIPCYDLRSGAPLLFSRADALEMDSCDFRMAGVCEATLAADRAVHLKSTDGSSKIVAVGGGVGMSNPTAAAITHVLNNKHEFPLCNGLQDLLVLSLGDHSDSPAAPFAKIAAHGAADMVDQAVSMAFGEWRRSNYVRIQGSSSSTGEKRAAVALVRKAEAVLREKNVESVLFEGKKLVSYTNMEKVEMLGGEVIKEEERRKNAILPTVVFKNSTSPTPRSSSATTLSTLSSN